jgi:alpha-tubulin suppressor-like RCC1 family protein
MAIRYVVACVLLTACPSETGVGAGPKGTVSATPTDPVPTTPDPTDPTVDTVPTVDSAGAEVVDTAGTIDSAAQVAVLDLDVGEDHVCAVDGDGLVSCWGNNGLFQSGQALPDPVLSPARVPGIDAVLQVALGDGLSCALRDDGTVWCWGRGDMLAQSAAASSPVPVQVAELTDIVAIEAERVNACALRADGVVLCWGANDDIQPGDPGFEDRPVEVAGLDPVATIAVGAAHRCALGVAGDVVCWGYGQGGRLGTGSEDTQVAPTPVTGLDASAGVTTVSAGSTASCAVAADVAHCWGSSDLAGTPENALTPAVVPGLGPMAAVSVGYAACGIQLDGALVCWGSNGFGALGTGDTAHHPSPFTVPLTGVTEVSAGVRNACARTADVVWCWGTLAIGDGSADPAYAPTAVFP